MPQTRFLTANEVVDTILYMYSFDKNNVRMPLSDGKIQELAYSYYERVLSNTGSICAILNDAGSIVATYVVIEYPEFAAWRVAGTKVLESTNHYAKTAKILAPGIDAVIEKMESKGYYKWWMIAPEQHHNIRNKIMVKYSKLLGRYEWYDDLVIPANSTVTGVKSFDNYREIIDWSDTVARMFVLRQEHRIKIFRDKNFKDYKGTMLNDQME
jgi:hypothetical protein